MYGGQEEGMWWRCNTGALLHSEIPPGCADLQRERRPKDNYLNDGKEHYLVIQAVIQKDSGQGRRHCRNGD